MWTINNNFNYLTGWYCEPLTSNFIIEQGGIGPYEKVVINFCFAPSSQFLQSEWERTRLMNKEFVLFMHIVPITTVPSGKMLIDAQYIKQSEISCYYLLYFDMDSCYYPLYFDIY